MKLSAGGTCRESVSRAAFVCHENSRRLFLTYSVPPCPSLSASFTTNFSPHTHKLSSFRVRAQFLSGIPAPLLGCAQHHSLFPELSAIENDSWASSTRGKGLVSSLPPPGPCSPGTSCSCPWRTCLGCQGSSGGGNGSRPPRARGPSRGLPAAAVFCHRFVRVGRSPDDLDSQPAPGLTAAKSS